MTQQARQGARSHLLLFFILVCLGLVSDLASKEWIFHRLGMPSWTTPPIWIVPKVFSLTTSLNEGALFGMGQQMTSIFSVISILAACAILYAVICHGAVNHSRLLSIALGLILAGILGNLYDRLGFPGLLWNYPPERIGQPVYAVRDWLHFKIDGIIDWPVFNIADSLLVCGAALIMASGLFQSDGEGNRAAGEISQHNGPNVQPNKAE